MSVPLTNRLSLVGISTPEKRHDLLSKPVSTETDPSDDQLLERLADGNSDSLVLLFERYYRLVWTIGIRVLRDKSEADDLSQDVFLFLFQNSRLFDASKGHARNWIVRVTYHRAFDRRDYLKARFSEGHEQLNESLSHNGSRMGKRASDFSDWICLKTHLEKALNELSEEQRATVRLHFYDGYNFREIGEQLGQTYGNVRHHYYRGIERLRQFAFDARVQENSGD